MSLEPVGKGSDQTRRYAEKRERIIDAASDLINEMGVKGMTFVDVAQRVALNSTSVTYYFKRKDLLAEAAFERALDGIEATVLEAAKGSDPRARVSAFIDLNLEEWARVRRREARPMARLSDVRALDDPIRKRLTQRYVGVFREMGHCLFGPADGEKAKALRLARTHVLLENMFWIPAWLGAYSTSDFSRVSRRLFEVFDKGVAAPGAAWSPVQLEIDTGGRACEADAGPETFLRAAARLINELGYRGASVERIASDLKVTKGSFYHHLDAKDDLVLECFQRSYARVSRAQNAAIKASADAWGCLSAAMSALLEVQFDGQFPLLRTAALQALPLDLRGGVLERSDRMARRFAGILIDGISEGSVRAIDPLIASQLIMAAINSAYEVRKWAAAQPEGQAIPRYASTIAYGLFADP